MEEVKELEIRYGELDIYYPLKFESSFSFEEGLEQISECLGRFFFENIEGELDEEEKALLLREYEAFKKRSDLINEEFKESAKLYGTVYTNAHERFLLFPIRVELCNGRYVWLQAILYIFSNNMCILKIELPLEDVSNVPIKLCEWDKYIGKTTCIWNRQATELDSIEKIKDMYISVIQKVCGIEVLEFNEYLHHVILADFTGCPYNVREISEDVQEELFRTIAAPITEAPYTTYREDAKAYIQNNSWGNHNIRCILKSTGGCLSILDRTVQEYWINQFTEKNGRRLTDIEYLDMYTQHVNLIQSSTEFPLIILLLKRINVLNDIKVKYEQGRKENNKYSNSKYEYIENNIFICTIQEDCYGTVSEQVSEFERLMPYYTKKEITNLKHESINEIIRKKETEKEEKYQKFISRFGLILSGIFGLPAINETVSILRNICVFIEGDIPYISKNVMSFLIWVYVLFMVQNYKGDIMKDKISIKDVMKKSNKILKKIPFYVKGITNLILTSRYFKMLILCIVFCLIPSITNWVIKTEAFIFPQFFGFVTSENESSWIGFLGAIIGGGITLIGVSWTIIDQNKKRTEDMKDMTRPIIVSTKCDYEKVKNIKNDTSGTKIIECILPIKNTGKGILYNPTLYNIVCKIDDVLIEKVNPTIPLLSYLDINESLQYDIMITLIPEMLKKLYDRLKGRGNTLSMTMTLHVGGNDMYGRIIMTELLYRLDITFDSAKEIDLGIPTGNLTSKVIFNPNEIDRVLKNRNHTYSIH